MSIEIKSQVLVLGSGPGGYSSAFRCADLGLKTVLVERYASLGGVCLNVGCIPSKALLHIAKTITDAKEMKKNGIVSGELKIDINNVRMWKEQLIYKLTTGLSKMAKARKINVLTGYGKFTSAHTIDVENKHGDSIRIIFDNAIIASGSCPIQLPFIPYEDSRVWNSTNSLDLNSVPNRLLIIGGGIIGLEMATIYHALGSKIDVVEMCDQLIPAADQDVVKFFEKYVRDYFNLMLHTKVSMIKTREDGLHVTMENTQDDSCTNQCYDAVLVAIGRTPNTKLLNLEQAGIQVDNLGFISVDKQMRTNISHIYAVGDIVGQPMLAHKGMYEGHLVAEVIAGNKYYYDSKIIPCIAYTDPEVAWVGLTEKEATKTKINFEVATFPWEASGRAVASNCSYGMTKLIFNKETHQIIGGAIVGSHGGELIGEIGLAIEMGCDVGDISLTMHAHPTLHESINLAAKIYEGTITDLLNIKAKKKQ